MALVAPIATKAAADNIDFIDICTLHSCWAKPEWLAQEFDGARRKPVRKST